MTPVITKVRSLAIVNGVTAANLYYCHPLLPQMAADLHAGAGLGVLAALGQLGYALGLVLVVPLGDIVRRRPLVIGLLCLDVAALATTAAAPNAATLLVAGTVIGVATSSVVQILLPHAAATAPPGERGRVVATMLGASLLGVLLSRTVAGLVSAAVGWRALFAAAAVGTLVLAATVARRVPAGPPDEVRTYRDQLAATVKAAADPVLRNRAAIGACVFGCFGAFWATVAFLLAAPTFDLDVAQIGLFALVGAAGAFAARLAGRAADRGHQHRLTGALLAVGVVSFGALALGGTSLAWLVVGVLAMDVAIGGVHLLNMSVVYARATTARTASVYMTAYTLGGVVGAAAGTAAYRVGGWPGVTVVGATGMVAGLLLWLKAPA